MSQRKGYITMGRISKPFGTQGFLRVVTDEKYVSFLQDSKIWFVEQYGSLEPFFVEDIQNDHAFIVKFEDIANPEEAKRVSGCRLFLREDDVPAETNGLDEWTMLNGYDLFNDDVMVGTISRLEQFPQQLMAFVQMEDMEILVPLVESFILDIDHGQKKLFMQLPEGLIESQL